jgi:hypothetical protein
MRKQFRLQSAMEYLMTYGWAILVIAVVLGALFQLGVFSSSSFSVRAPPGACQIFRTSSAVNLVGQCSGILPQYVAKFNGQGSYVEVSQSSNLNSIATITVSAWILPSGLTTYAQNIVDKGPGNPEFAFTNSRDLYFWIRDTAGTLRQTTSSSSKVTIGAWQHVAATYDGTNTIFYVNGAGETVSSAFGNMQVRTDYLDIGAEAYYIHLPSVDPSALRWFYGSMTNIQVYNASLSSSDIQALYQEGMGGAPIRLQNLVAWWPLNSDTKDYSGTGNTGVPAIMTYASQYGK